MQPPGGTVVLLNSFVATMNDEALGRTPQLRKLKARVSSLLILLSLLQENSKCDQHHMLALSIKITPKAI